ncbi:MAG: ATP synthase F1 subunit gamma [Clostridiales bacterium]|nr:ATP synthase F1 subunit gamma [Clostridiales bacterium]
MKTISRRIASVSSTQQIVRAMDMVSASKLQRAKGQIESAGRLFAEAERMMDGMKNCSKLAVNPFFTMRCVETTILSDSAIHPDSAVITDSSESTDSNGSAESTVCIVITGDRGLCGAYNQNIIDAALGFFDTRQSVRIIAIGLQGWECFERLGKTVLHGFADISETALYDDAERIGHILIPLYLSGETNAVYIAYTRFASSLSHVPSIEKLLPLEQAQHDDYGYDSIAYEPDAEAFAGQAVPFFINAYIYNAIIQSAACEHAARMASMHSASDNADAIIEKLTLAYNRQRQGALTQEISEIVGGAKALRGKQAPLP